MIEVIIAEKPSTAKKIAEAVKDTHKGNMIVERHNKIPIYIIKNDHTEVRVVSAAGHLFSLHTPTKNTYPVFDVEWMPLYKINKTAKYTKEYIEAIKKYGKGDKYVVATDYDIEGETIAYNILTKILNIKDAQRMKFSSLTKEELKQAYENKLKSITYGLAMAGIARHTIDFFYGINLSRGLMYSLKRANRFRILSIGRVQGPALGILVQREKEILQFKPEKYYTIEGETQEGLKIKHIKERIKDKEEAKNIFSKIKDIKEGVVDEINIKKISVKAPHPYNLSDLQTDAYNIYKISPQQTQEIAQRLYEKALISYPRTSSQKLPPTLNVKKILEDIGKINKYAQYTKKALNTPLIPHNGKKEDPAHPAIYPTGEMKEIAGLSPQEKKIYDLIIRRFIATFLEDMIKEKTKGHIKIKDEAFVFEYSKIAYKGWFEVYEDLIKEENSNHTISKNTKIKIKKIELKEKETQPPKRYSPATLIKELEKRKLGTKATRAMILETLYKREYITGKNKIEVTPLGMKIYEIMEKYVPEVLSETLTRKVEEKLEQIEQEKIEKEEVIEEVKKQITSVCDKIKRHELEIGKEIISSEKEKELKEKTMGRCVCGGTLIIKTTQNKKRFIGCTQYPECKETYTIPQKGKIIETGRCSVCGNIKIKIRNKKTYETCISPECKEHFTKKFGGVEGGKNTLP